MWDYLRRSGQGGYFLPLSGGIDSSSSACIVASMCHLVCAAVNEGGAALLYLIMMRDTVDQMISVVVLNSQQGLCSLIACSHR